MKVRNAAIAVVLIALGLGAFAFRDYWWSPRAGAERYLTETQSIQNTVTQLMVRKIGASNLLAALGNRLNWAAIESTNYVVYIQNLRNFGCPEETIRDIIITDIAKLYAKKRAALRSQYPAPGFWQASETWSQGADSNPELQARIRQLDDEQRALVKELLGVNLDLELAKIFETEDPDDQRYAFLPADRRQALQALVAKYDQLEQNLYERTKGLMLEEDQAQLQQLQKMREAEIAQLLSPEELREYELRNSPTADSLREQLSGFEANETEFRRLFDLQKAYEAQMTQMPPGADDEVRANVAEKAEDALNDELRKVLGEERFAEYQRAQDADYKMLVQFADRVEMPKDVINQVYGLKSRIEEQRDVIESDASLTDEQRAIAMAALAQTANTQIERLMGPENSKKYLPFGHWVNDLHAGAGPGSAVSPEVVAPVNPPVVSQPPPFPPVAPYPPPVPFPSFPQRIP